jgi:putative amino-acid transport system substrate-binding protein
MEKNTSNNYWGIGENTMKKFVTLTLSTLIALGLTACGSTNQKPASENANTNQKAASGDANANQKVIKVGSTGQSYPNGYKENGQLTGFDVDLTNVIAKDLGYKVEWVTSDFSGLMGQVGAGKIDTVANAVSITPKRQEQFNFTVPYSYYGAQIVTSNKNTNINTLADLKGKTVAGVLGSNNVTNLQNYDKNGEIKIRTYENRDGAEQDVINNRVDGYIQSRPVLLAAMKKSNLPLKFVGDPVAYDSVGYPFAKNANGDELQKAFSAEIQKLEQDGTIGKLSTKYFGEDISKKAGK